MSRFTREERRARRAVSDQVAGLGADLLRARDEGVHLAEGFDDFHEFAVKHIASFLSPEFRRALSEAQISELVVIAMGMGAGRARRRDRR